MRAIVYTAPLTLEHRAEQPEPVAGPGEVVVEVRAVGICGSELEGFRSQSPFRVPPLVMGHELAGVRLDTGERVTVNPLIACGRCDRCLRGLRNVCRTRALVGIQRDGGFAERVALPEACCVPLPDGLSFADGALVEPVANAVHALALAQAHDPQPARVGVIGAGMLGLATALVAQRLGVEQVVITDLSAERLESARAAGVRHTAERLSGEFDVIVDAVGSAQTRATSAELLVPGGSAVWIGLHGADAGFDGLALIRGERRVLGTFAYLERDFARALEIVAQLDTSAWVASAPLDDGVEVFLDLLERPPAHAKTLLVP
ncbi:MAG TPA: alcohol dehydrogenase catalytic domain-containing protein [Conexibacter sp.]|nr:alcohol dehydrogenase catalytic domain-containing protein [Conexibacter sp.]